jgi:hypothetical protein
MSNSVNLDLGTRTACASSQKSNAVELESKQVQSEHEAQPAGWAEGKDERLEHRIREQR